MKAVGLKVKGSLIGNTLSQMALRIALVILGATTISYFHLMSVLEAQTQQQLQKYIAERGQRESNIFTLATDNQALLKQELQQQLKEMGDRDPKAEFDRRFFKWSDGSTRSIPQNQPIQSVDTEKYPIGFIGKQVKINADVRRRILTFYNIAQRYGPIWRTRFVDIYMDGPENFDVTYWPGVQWGLEVEGDFYIPDQEYFYVADHKHNPERKPTWTGLYFDPVAKLWMVSLVTPVDNAQGQQIASIGNDIIMQELMDRTINNRLEGTYNLIFRNDGRLIIHPARMAEIQQKKGQYNILESGDRHLKQIFQLVRNAQSDAFVVENKADNEYLAVTRIKGPEWYLVTVYPKSILASKAFDNARFILILGLLSLLIEVAALYFVLRQQVAKPLATLTSATQQIAAGNFNIHLDATRRDELGLLAASFNRMSQEVATREQGLSQAEAEARQLAAENSRMSGELDITRRIQQMILPNPEELQQVPGLDIAGFMQPTNEVGGDYYDVMQSNGLVKIGIGDVTGHGLESGVLMLMIQTAIRTLLENQETDSTKFLNTLNRVIYNNARRMNSQKNLSLSLLDYQSGLVKLSGQHEEILVVRADGQVSRLDTVDLGFFLGLLPDISDFVNQAEVQLQPGDGIVLYTDGITEAENSAKDYYGLERLCQVVSKNWHQSAEGVRQAVIEDVQRYIGEQEVRDDITLLILKQQ
jgi:serine phosphatase RsbU (regulator of sigma subunit)